MSDNAHANQIGVVAKFTHSKFTHWLDQPHRIQRLLEGCILLTLITVTIGERSLFASQRHIMPAGDVFNFQSIARNIRHFDYPIREKRLPGFPLALLVGMELGFDPTHTGIAISILSSAATTAILYLLGRRFGFPPLPLALCLLLTSIAPLLTINGIRPLSDSFFLFLIVLSVYMATIIRPTRTSALLTGVVLTLLAFTRYEGIPTAFLLLALLRFRVPWRYVFLAATPLLIAILLWLPVAKKVHGSIREFGYFRDAEEIADVSKVPREYVHILKSAGFGRAWQILDLNNTEDKQARLDAQALIYNPTWWLSLLGNFGIIWLIVSVRKKALPLLVAFAFYPILPAWWFLYSRYVAPMSAFYWLATAAGAAGMWVIVRWLLKRAPAPVHLVAALILTVMLIRAVIGVMPGMVKEAHARALENNGNGYSLYQALMSLRKTDEHVAVSFDYLMAYMMFGMARDPKDGLNAGRGIYLSAKPEASPPEMAAYLKQQRAEILIDNGEKEVKPVVEYLKKQNLISATKVFAWPRQDGDIDKTYLHYLRWPE